MILVTQRQCPRSTLLPSAWAMSIIARRFLKFDPPIILNSTEIEALLQIQKALVQIILTDRAFPCSDVYIETVFLALTLLNASLNSRLAPSIALQSGNVTLSIVSTLHDLVPDMSDLTERDSKYVTSLSSDIRRLHLQLSEAHRWTINSPGSPRVLQATMRDLQRSHEAFLRKASNFFTDPDLSARRAIRNAREKTDAYVVKWEDVTLGERYNEDTGFHNTFWDHTYRAVVQDTPVFVKTYPLASLKDFRRDLETLRSNRHAHLPALFAHSDNRSSIPFIAVSIDSFVPLHEYVSTLGRKAPNIALGEVWKTFIKFRYTAEYLFKQGICTYEHDLVETFEAVVVSPTGQVVIAPTFAEQGSISTFATPMAWDSLPLIVGSFYNGFFVAQPSRFAHWPPADIHLCDLDPLRHALREDPVTALHSSYSQFTDPASQRRALARWRPRVGSASTRNIGAITARTPFRNANEQPIVGDVGRFTNGPVEEDSEFVKFTNVQEEVGGYEYQSFSGEQVQDGVWRVKSMEEYTWRISILPEIALDYLSVHGKRLAQEYGVPPEDLVFVTGVSFGLMRWLDVGQDNRFLFVHFDKQGRWLRHYWSPSSADDLVPCTFAEISESDDINMNVTRVQIEEDELTTTVDDDSSSFATKASLGDVGYYAYDLDGRHNFHAVRNSFPDLMDVKAQCLEVNGGKMIEPRLLSFPANKSPICYSWKASASVNLPIELANRYISQFVHSDRGYQISRSTGTGIVDKVTYQLRITTPPDIFDHGIGRIFVRLCDDGMPQHISYSASEAPSQGLEQTLPSEAWRLTKYAEISRLVKSIVGAPVASHPPPGRIREETGPEPSKVADVGYWEHDNGDASTDHWVNIGHIALPVTSLQVHQSGPSDDEHFTQVSPYLWQSQFAGRLTKHSARGEWLQAMPCTPLMDLISEIRNLADQHHISQDKVLLVTQVTASVSATANANTRIHSWAQAYVSYPPGGRCYAYWTNNDHTVVNPRLLSAIDLDDIFSGFGTQASFKVDRVSLDDLLKMGEQSMEINLVQSMATKSVIVKTEKAKPDSLRQPVRIAFTITPHEPNGCSHPYKPVPCLRKDFGTGGDESCTVNWRPLFALMMYEVNGRKFTFTGGHTNVTEGNTATLVSPTSWTKSGPHMDAQRASSVLAINNSGSRQNIVLGSWHWQIVYHPLQNGCSITVPLHWELQAYIVDDTITGDTILQSEDLIHPIFPAPILWENLPEESTWILSQDRTGLFRISNGKLDPVKEVGSISKKDTLSEVLERLTIMEKSITRIQEDVSLGQKATEDIRDRLSTMESTIKGEAQESRSNIAGVEAKTNILADSFGQSKHRLSEVRDAVAGTQQLLAEVKESTHDRLSTLEGSSGRTQNQIATVEKAVHQAQDHVSVVQQLVVATNNQLSMMKLLSGSASGIEPLSPSQEVRQDKQSPVVEARVKKLENSVQEQRRVLRRVPKLEADLGIVQASVAGLDRRLISIEAMSRDGEVGMGDLSSSPSIGGSPVMFPTHLTEGPPMA